MFEKLNPERESFGKPEKNTEEAVKKQSEISILGDVSSEDYIDKLNQKVKERGIIDKKENVLDEQSWEEMIRDEELIDKINNLQIKYIDLKEEIKKRQNILDELNLSKEGAEKSVKNLNWKELVSREGNSVVTSMMRNAEDRVERLKNKIEKNQIELTPLIIEFGEITEIINSLSELIKVEIKDEDGSIQEEGYNFNLN